MDYYPTVIMGVLRTMEGNFEVNEVKVDEVRLEINRYGNRTWPMFVSGPSAHCCLEYCFSDVFHIKPIFFYGILVSFQVNIENFTHGGCK